MAFTTAVKIELKQFFMVCYRGKQGGLTLYCHHNLICKTRYLMVLRHR